MYALWALSGHLFDVDSALRAGHDHVLATRSIEGDAEVELLGDIDCRRNQHFPHRVPANVEPEYSFRGGARLVGRAGYETRRRPCLSRR